MKKVLFVVDEQMMGGVSTVLKDMIHLLDLNRFAISILVLHNRGEQFHNLDQRIKVIYGTPYFSAVDYTFKEVIRSKNIHLLFHKIQIVLAMKTGLILKRIEKERRKMQLDDYDIEIAFKDGFCAIFTATSTAKKKIHWLHYEYRACNPNAKYDRLFQKILPLYDYIVAVSKNVANTFNTLYHLENKMVVINNVVDTQRILQLAKQDVKVDLSPAQLNIVSVGRLHEVKGYERLIQVMKRLNKEHLLSDVTLDIYGDGPQYSKLAEKIQAFHLENIIALKGKSENPYALIKQYDFSIVPSLYEAFGLSIVESLLLHVPVLATQTAASHEIIDDNNNGWICENSEEGLYTKIKELLIERDKIEKCRKKIIHYTYDNDTIIKQIEKLFS